MNIANVTLDPPVMNAACSIAKTIDDVRAWCRTKTGVVLVGSITVEPRSGNDEPRWFVGNGYALNSFGMPNEGLVFYHQHLPEMINLAHKAGKKFALSIAGFRPEEYAELAEVADDVGVDLLELNLGCPNVSVEGKQKPIVSFDADAINDVVDAVHEVTGIPLMVKLSPYSNPAELGVVAECIASTDKVSAVVTSNTFPNGLMLKDGKSVLGSHYGGVSGRAMLPISLGQVEQFRKLLPDSVAVIGVGGIESKEDVKMYFEAGASAVQVATLAVRAGHQAIDKVI